MKSVTDCRKWLFCSLACFFTAFLIAVSANTCKQEADASRIAPYVLRFHILAESNSKTDQQLKLKVREQVLSYIQENAPAHAGKEELASWLLSRREDIILNAEQTLAYYGRKATVDLNLSHDHFPARTYGNAFFPCGYYDAARLTIGKGKGRNWWCVLYPRFCFLDEACREIPEESRRELQEKLNQGDYPLLEDHRPDLNIRFFFFPEFRSVLPSHSTG